MNKKNTGGASGFAGTVGKVLLLIIETVVLVVISLYIVLFIHFKGPSPTVGVRFASMLQESSALKFVPTLFYSEEKMNEIMSYKEDVYVPPTDTSLITIEKDDDNPSETGNPGEDAYGLIDDDGDGIILEEVHGSGYSGYMMVVLDPSRVIMGSVPSSFGTTGYTVEQMVKYYGAVAGTNAGGFYDPNGQGDGSIPDTLVVFDGKMYYAGNGVGAGFVGIDYDCILHVGLKSAQEITDANIRYGVCFGPVLVSNGVMNDEKALSNGPNPRTAIGQRADGAILLLVIDGRQTVSMGASYLDLAKIMLRYGAVNACNLDGGSSSLMWFKDKYVNNKAMVIGVRPVPTTFIVLAAEEG